MKTINNKKKKIIKKTIYAEMVRRRNNCLTYM